MSIAIDDQTTDLRTAAEHAGGLVGVARVRAFRRARFHSGFVRAMRVVFPVTCAVLFVGYGVLLQNGIRLEMGSGTLAVGPISVSTETLVALDPQYEGFSKDGGRFLVKAAKAEQDLKQTGPVRLVTIDGTFIEANKTKTYLTAVRGTFDTKTNVLELMERIDITGDSGLRAVLTQATVDTKEGRIFSPVPVAVTMPTGTVVGNEMEIRQKAKQVSFRKGVKSRLSPAVAPPGDPKTAPRAAGIAGMQGSGPVDITADRLDIDDAQKVAVYSGNVAARQGEALVQSASLQAHYEGAPAGASAGASASSDGRLKQIVFPEPIVMTQGSDRVTANKAEFDVRRDLGVLIGDVVITSGAEGRATGDRAEFDSKSDTALLLGNVVVTQGKNVLKGRRLAVDRRTGRTQLASPADGGSAKGRIAARFYQAEDATKQQAAKKAAPAAAKSEQDPLMQAFQSDPGAPIDIESDVLDADDKAKTATFRGQVRVVQSTFTLTSAELVASYSGETGLGMGNPATAQQGQKGQGAQLQRIVARQNVLIVNKDGSNAMGDTADFDMKTNRIVLIGNVTLTQQGAITTGQKAVFDIVTGRANIIDDAGIGAPKSRPVLMLYPEQLKEAQQKKKLEAQPNPKTNAEPLAPAPKPAVQPRTSGWGTQTTVGTP